MSKARELASLGNAYSDGALSNRNLIINGAMQVAQRGTSFVDPNGYTLDRFPVFGTVDVSRISGFSNFQYAMRITGKTGNTIAIGQQRIEGLNAAHLTGKSVTLSFYAKASTPITVGWSAATANSYDNFGASTNFGTGTFSVTTTETRYTVTIDNVPSSCANGILITFSPNNYGAFTSGTFDITGVQLEVGDTATPFEHRSYGQELALCQRYYSKVKAREMWGAFESTTGIVLYRQNPMPMRASPTTTRLSTVLCGTAVGARTDNGSWAFIGSAANGITIAFTANTAAPFAQPVVMDGDDAIAVDAEL